MEVDISIIIPIYNPPHDNFERCIGSLVSQTGGLSFEFIFVNDGSTDTWIAERLERLEKEDSHVVVITKENEGVSVARNTGMERAKGEYIAFVDHDDYMLDSGLEYMYRETSRHGAEIGMFGYSSTHYGGGIINEHWHNMIEGENKTELIKEIVAEYGDMPFFKNGISSITIWAKIYNREFLLREKLRFIPRLEVDDDRVFNLEAYGKANRILADNEKVYHYEFVSGSLSNKVRQRHLPMIKVVVGKIKRLLYEIGYDSVEMCKAMNYRTFFLCMKFDYGYLCNTTQEVSLCQRHRDFCAFLDDDIIMANIKKLSIETLKRYSIRNRSQLARLFIYKHKLVWILTAKTWIKQKIWKR